MNFNKKIGKLFIRDSNWCSSWFQLHPKFVDEKTHDIIYMGITIMGWSLLYSDVWED